MVHPRLGKRRSLINSITHNRDREFCLLVEECNPFLKNPQKLQYLFHMFGGPPDTLHLRFPVSLGNLTMA
jgi:hypothetical protein